MAYCCFRIFKGFRRCVQAAKQRAVWLSSDCVNGKYLWALPTPTTFEKVDQTFIIDCRNNLLNHNLFYYFTLSYSAPNYESQLWRILWQDID